MPVPPMASTDMVPVLSPLQSILVIGTFVIAGAGSSAILTVEVMLHPFASLMVISYVPAARLVNVFDA